MQLKEEELQDLLYDIKKGLTEIPESITSGVAVITIAFRIFISKKYASDMGLVEFKEILLKILQLLLLEKNLPYHINDQLFVLITTTMASDLITTIYGLTIFKKVATKRSDEKGLLSCFKKKEEDNI